MWSLGQTAKATGTRPSELVRIDDAWTALQFDNAVTLVVNVIENAAQERENVGSEKRPDWQLKYTMSQLLDDDFRLPAPKTKEQKERDAANAFAGLPGVRRVRRTGNGKDS